MKNLLLKIQTIREEFSQNLEFNETVELLENELPREFVYPVEQYPEKIKSLNLDKTPKIRGILQGIKGQYLILILVLLISVNIQVTS